jgi:hypothetical protein
LTTDGWTGHEIFYIVAPTTKADGYEEATSKKLAELYHPTTKIREGWFDEKQQDGEEWKSFFDTSKAERILGWKHDG